MLTNGDLIVGLVVVVLLNVTWIISGAIHRKKAARMCGMQTGACNFSRRDHDREHRALIYLMTQKIDSVLIAMAQTIEQERQKLGMGVMNPPTTVVHDACQDATLKDDSHTRSVYTRVLPLAGNGMSVSQIARELRISESEVSMVMRLKAA